MPGFSIVVAMDKDRGIGLNGRLPWKLSGDMRFFRDLTTCPDRAAVEQRYGLVSGSPRPAEGDALPKPSPEHRNAVLMGRKTWDSLPAAFKPLPNRLNGVLSRSRMETDGTHRLWSSLRDAVFETGRDESIESLFVIGGAQIYAEALGMPECDRIYLTTIDASYSCDAFLAEIPADFHEAAVSETMEEQGIPYRFHLLQRLQRAG